MSGEVEKVVRSVGSTMTVPRPTLFLYTQKIAEIGAYVT